jgi:hypothetical protein
MAEIGFTAANVYARDITEPDRVIRHPCLRPQT